MPSWFGSVKQRPDFGENHRKRGPRGYDAIVVDTQGLLLAVTMHPGCNDSWAASPV